MRNIIIIAHNLRSTYNVGSLLRTAEGLGVEKVFLTGYTPYPVQEVETRLPHLSRKIDQQIKKTALGAENLVNLSYCEHIEVVLKDLKNLDYTIVALEQHKNSIKLTDYDAPDKIALIVGREVEGIEQDVLDACDQIIEIPMLGKKESFNVVQAAAMAIYHFRYVS